MKRAVVLGYGELDDFHPVEGRTALDAAAEACTAALKDAGVSPAEIDGLIVGNPLNGGSMFGSTLANHLALKLGMCSTISLGGASGVGSVLRAASAVETGICDVVVAVYADARASSREGASWRQALEIISSMVSHPDYERPFGLTAAAAAGLMAMHYLHTYSTDVAVLSEVAKAAHEYSMHAGSALRGFALTDLAIERSPFVSEPLRSIDCCLVSDFGGAVVVAASDYSSNSNSVSILGYGEAAFHKYMTGASGSMIQGAKASSSVAFGRAGLSIKDVDVIELYDAFTIYTLMLLEALEACPDGQAGEFVSDGYISLNGPLPCNTNGGMLAYAHGGSLHVVEAIRQLRGEAEELRQVVGPEVALVHGVGGTLSHHATLILGI